jgi:hypothetical protein
LIEFELEKVKEVTPFSYLAGGAKEGKCKN